MSGSDPDVEVVTTDEELERLAPEWLELQDKSTPFYVKYDSVKAWWGAYRQEHGHDLCIVVARERGEAVGIAPLVLTPGSRNGRKIRRLRFASHGDYMGFVLTADQRLASVAMKKIFRYLWDHAEWDTLSLSNVDVSNYLAGHFLRSPVFNPCFNLHIENPVLNLTHYSSFEEYESAQGLGSVRKRAARFRREIEHRFVVIRGDSNGSLLGQMGDLHIREKNHLQDEHGRSERHSLFEDPLRVRHCAAMYSDPDRTLTFGFISPEGDLLSYKSAYIDGGSLLCWNSAYAPEVASYRVNTVLQYEILRHLFKSREFERFDFGAGRYHWKFTWTQEFRSTYRLLLRRNEQ
ncbi:GNAT family N-acetyltransferase [Serinicoccus kebangsaanensis]|uniref:GNAT family N-acetyltransferase n=1 Tax=Serinicoccus kebangsaanensis TaxID=2602069 RepID=UPI00124C422F|nr:GNAT family N-acetyltransferase [Serinicoccus kebangsaanensis]